jgi:hypothetical protein
VQCRMREEMGLHWGAALQWSLRAAAAAVTKTLISTFWSLPCSFWSLLFHVYCKYQDKINPKNLNTHFFKKEISHEPSKGTIKIQDEDRWDFSINETTITTKPKLEETDLDTGIKVNLKILK